MANVFPPTMLDFVPSLETPGFRLVDTGELYQLLSMMLSVNSSVAATGNNSQAAAKVVTAAINSVLSASATQNSLVLPDGIVGRQVIIVNNTNVALNIFPQGVDFIIPSGSSTPGAGTTQAASTTAAYICILRNTNVSPQVSYWKQASPV